MGVEGCGMEVRGVLQGGHWLAGCHLSYILSQENKVGTVTASIAHIQAHTHITN